MDLVDHFRLIWRRRWLVVIVSIVIAGGVYAYTRTLSEVYEARATIDVIPSATSPASLTPDQVGILTDRYASLASTTTLLEDGVDESGLNITISTARGRVSAGSDDPGFVTITAEGPSPATARALASGVVQALVASAEAQDAEVTIVSPARAPDDPVRPTPARDAALAFLVALVVNAELAAILGWLGGRLSPGRAREELERVTDTPVLAQIPRRDREAVIEAFRELRAQVDFARSDLDARSVAVVGVEPGCGTSFVARGLAQVAANLKGSVALVDANLRRPSVAPEMHLPPSPGLGDILLGAPFDAALLRQANPLQKRFRVLTAGLAVPDAPGLLGAGALHKVLDEIPDAELIVVDAPSIAEGPDALVIGAQCAASIVVLDARHTRKDALRKALTRLEPHARLLGTVVNLGERETPYAGRRRWTLRG
jgi:succinoglycan biosynthesis transport protein ExoP